jgi:excisionase family DNA binding protein
MVEQRLSITAAARLLGVSSRTIRRYIKSGKIKAELTEGVFGKEYHILELPPELHKRKPLDNMSGQSPSQNPVQPSFQIMDIVKELQEKNLNLAAQLGIATERIRNLENEVKLLTTVKQQSWWKRLFRRHNKPLHQA